METANNINIEIPKTINVEVPFMDVLNGKYKDCKVHPESKCLMDIFSLISNSDYELSRKTELINYLIKSR
jgi:hypothetical protein